MYLQHFGFAEPPFTLTPDPAFAVPTRSQQAALNTLLVALEGGEGFVKVTGEVGLGKTLLCRTLLARLGAQPARWASAYLPNPRLTPRQLLLELATELERALPERTDERHAQRAIEQALVDHARQQRAVVVVVDEAQAMPVATLEALRLLSNLETGKRKLVQIVFFAQPEFDAVLGQPLLRSLASRIAFGAVLEPMDSADAARYLAERLRTAGGRDAATLFSPRARWWLQRASRGVPRLVNIVAHKSLLLAYGRGDARVRWRDVWRAGRDRCVRVARRPATLAARSVPGAGAS